MDIKLLDKNFIDENDSIDAAFEKLEMLVSELESNEHSLEETFSLYAAGVKLVEACGKKIDTVEKNIMIINDRGGENGFKIGNEE